MRFKFCSDADCPQWVLAALNAMGSLPAPVFRSLLQHVVEELSEDGIMIILKNTSLSSRAECARAAAAIRWILHQTSRCACSSIQLTRDLLVMGVPRAHAAAFAEAANQASETHLAQAQNRGFAINKLADASLADSPEGAVDSYSMTLFTSHTCTGQRKPNELLIEKNVLETMLKEMIKARGKMDELRENETA